MSIHPDEALLGELRERQTTPEGQAQLRERTHVEHSLAHMHNLHVIARQPRLQDQIAV